MFGLRHEPKMRATQEPEGQGYSDPRVCDFGDWLDDCLQRCFRAYAQEGQGHLEQDVKTGRRAGTLGKQLVMGVCL